MLNKVVERLEMKKNNANYPRFKSSEPAATIDGGGVHFTHVPERITDGYRSVKLNIQAAL